MVLSGAFLLNFIAFLLVDHLRRDEKQVQMCRFIKLTLDIYKVSFVSPQFACVFNKTSPFYLNKDMTQKKQFIIIVF